MKNTEQLTPAEADAERRFFRALAEIPNKVMRQRVRDALLRDRKHTKNERIEKLEELVSGLCARVDLLEGWDP